MAKWRTAKVFISSTFRDMHAERDHLVKVVFPELRERLIPYRVYLDDIDLRWGITEEESKKDRVLDLCLQQIDECRPFFIGILGERYGWVPDRYPTTARSKYGEVQFETGCSVTELEILFGVLLMDPTMRDRSFFYFRDPHALDSVPPPIRAMVYAETDPRWITKLTSLKEKIRKSGLPLLDGYPAAWDPKAYDRPTKTQGRLVELDAFGRQVRDQLWEAIRAEFKLPDQPPAPARTDEAARFAAEADDQARFVESRLRVYVGRKDMRNQLAAFADGNERKLCLLTGESGSGKSAALARFVRTYRRARRQTIVISHFIGASPRSTALRDMLKRLCVELYEKLLKTERDVRLAQITATGEEAGTERQAIEQVYAIPEEIAPLVTTWRNFLKIIPAEHRVVFVLDALNQLEEGDRARDLWWLPRDLEPHMKVIASCIVDPESAESESDPVARAFRHRPVDGIRMAGLDPKERERILREVPSLSAKTLDDKQVRMLLDNPASENPLYLRVALEELRGFGSYDDLNARIGALPRPGLADEVYERAGFSAQATRNAGDPLVALYTQMILRLGSEFSSSLVHDILTMLAAARRGLSERELQEFLAEHPDNEDLFPVLRQLRPNLMNRTGLLDFYHAGLDQAVRKCYFDTEEKHRVAHKRLADSFERQDLRLGTHGVPRPRGWDRLLTSHSVNVRKVDELPWQWVNSGQLDQAEGLIANLSFLEAKVEAGMLFDLVRDCDWIIEARESRAVMQVRKALSRGSSALAAHPALTLQTIYNRLIWADDLDPNLRTGLEHARRELDCWPFWIRSRTPLPDTGNHSPLSLSYPISSTVQFFCRSRRLLAMVPDGGTDVEIRDLSRGELIDRRSLCGTAVRSLSLWEDTLELACMTVRGQIQVEHKSAVLEGRSSDSQMVCSTTHGLIAVRRDHALVSWDPECGEALVLAANVPAPLITLRSSLDDRMVFYLAGANEQRCGFLILSDSGWFHQHLPCPAVTCFDADVNFESGWALFASQDRRLRVMDVERKTTLAELAYETRRDCPIRGTPLRCTLGRGEALEWAFLATRSGQVAAWNWHDDRLLRLEDFTTAWQGVNLILFEALPGDGDLFLSSPTGGRIVTRDSLHSPSSRHIAEVSGCLVTGALSEVVSYSERDRTVRWFSSDGLRPLAQQAVSNPAPNSAPTALSPVYGSDDVWVGTSSGWVCKLPPTGEPKVAIGGGPLLESVVCLSTLKGGDVVAAGRSGRIVHLDTTSEEWRLICPGVPFRVQNKVLPAGRNGLVWSIHREEKAEGWSTVVSLINAAGKDCAIWTAPDLFLDSAASPDGNLVCLTGERVVVLDNVGGAWVPHYQRHTPTAIVAWIGESDLLAVAPLGSRWIEIWRVEQGLPSVAAGELPNQVTCLNSMGNWLAIGFASGELMVVTLEGEHMTNITQGG
jgi:hypothetical protein